jgi:hypothetical protein
VTYGVTLPSPSRLRLRQVATGTRTELYQVYAHLRRLGFIVKRHRAPWVVGKPGGVSELDGPDDRDALCPHAGCVCSACMPLKSRTRHERHLMDLVQPPAAAAAAAAEGEADAAACIAAADAADIAATERWFGSKRRRTGEHGSQQVGGVFSLLVVGAQLSSCSDLDWTWYCFEASTQLARSLKHSLSHHTDCL